MSSVSILNLTQICQRTESTRQKKKLSKELIEGNFANEKELKDIEKMIDSEISRSVTNALEASDPKPEELTKYIWAED